MVDWVAAVLKRRTSAPVFRAEPSTPIDKADPIREPIWNESSSVMADLEAASASGRHCSTSAADLGQLITDFQTGELLERFCIQTIDGDLSDDEAIQSTAESLPAPSYDAILNEVAPTHIPSTEDHAEAITRWMEAMRVQRQRIVKTLKKFYQRKCCAVEV